MSLRYLGVDLGTRRIGLAISEPESGVVTPLRVVPATGDADRDAREVLAVAREYEVAGIVVGLPLNMDGTEGPQAKLSRRFADQLAHADAACAGDPARRALTIHLHDERLTSHAADEILRQHDLTRGQKRARHDAIAASVLLQSFLESKPLSPPPGGTDASPG